MGVYAAILTILSGLFLMHKSDNAMRNHQTVIDAIYEYKKNCIIQGKSALVDYEDIEPFEITVLRVWDFSCENVLPEEKYNLIKEYIK